MQFTDESAHRPKVVAHLPVAMSPSYSAIADAIFYDPVPQRCSFPFRMDHSRGSDSAPFLYSWIPWLTTLLSTVLEPSTGIISPVRGTSVVSPGLLVARSSGLPRSGGQRGTSPSPDSGSDSVSNYLSRFHNWLDCRRLAVTPNV